MHFFTPLFQLLERLFVKPYCAYPLFHYYFIENVCVSLSLVGANKSQLTKGSESG